MKASAGRLYALAPGGGVGVDRNHDDDHQRRHRDDEQFQQREVRIADRVRRRLEREESEGQRNRVCDEKEEDGPGCRFSESAVVPGEIFVCHPSTPLLPCRPWGPGAR